ncbi:heavy metal-responsive transcriptional regulator [Acaryochloris marina]|uniref:Transcriptional regulator, MerR family n=1 Tax=Acaryochloris marina (strain MBIC 11017) TaxID=329726 RepID=B0C156_ACAM1|nr:heavy metal-responsive transcriptional regulator [Acaryochloris marina]ABW28454.1 transcriptional regulator, MerR family [Acaryochloris marina MBIC11017]BDM77457.1 MerR family transcriptional regulator [Acaryochloris marina MBIC10699]
MTRATRLKIGEVRQQTGVAVGALRYYESLELIHSDRGDNGYRYYPQETVQQVQFIKKAQTLGFSLEEIREILNIHQQGDIPCERVQSMLQGKIEQLDHQIQQIMSFKSELEHYRDRWATNQPRPQPGDICPLISTVSL